MTTSTTSTPDRKPEIDYILSMNEVCAITGISRHTIYRMIALKLFPTPGRVGTRRIGWRTSKINAWLENRFGT